eukprot:CAMPEP_0170469614 /NCGR_PEP_ID=MMETSP0123-20130129/12384_1 /TAXON_ID=182087 /ORGANISM="Favella ehrenbergii, Strain Fehren 1" /LENGTH=33 /DNA_ID= /DNA_START= /DNA_END= /DNA_ORIENTATION=
MSQSSLEVAVYEFLSGRSDDTGVPEEHQADDEH